MSIEYIERAPHSTPTLAESRRYRGIAAALLAFAAPASQTDVADILHFQKTCKRYNIDFAQTGQDGRGFVIRMAGKSFYTMRA